MDGYQSLTKDKLQTTEGINELNRMLKKLFQVIAGDGENVRVFYSYGTPESNLKASIGAVYLRKDGGANTTLYIKESGTGDTGWAAM